MGRDMTKQKQIEKALRESEEKFRLLFERSADAMALIDEGVFVDCNNEALQMLGFSSKEQLLSLRPSDISPGKQPDGMLSVEKEKIFFNETFEKGSLRFEWVHRRKNGEEFPAEVSLTSIMFHNRKIFQASWRDITERKRSELLMKESEERYRIAIEHSNDGVAIVRRDKLIFVNSKYAEMFGYDNVNELTGRSISITTHREDRKRVLKISKDRFAGKHAPDKYEFRGIRKDGGVVYIENSATTIIFKGDRASLTFLRDVTERKQAEEKLRRSHAQLKVLSRKLSETEEMEKQGLARELHDKLGQNLTAIAINLSIIQSKVPGKTMPRVSPYIEDAMSLIELTSESVRDLMAELRAPVLDDYGLLAALQWYGEQCTARTGIIVHAHGKALKPRPKKHVESTLFRIAQEAITNAIKHAGSDEIDIELKEINSVITLTIEDKGTGFEYARWSGSKRKKTPGNWGLITMAERSEGINGHFRIESKKGRGTKVIVEVPR